ncbi:GNAT family N-acetyltransferase [Proteiniclasticum ruminis]|uniref:Acetyltransferase (GNAT) domain-containing protein n=1 Tax=Proteiniclasticum ruminis TaxID=398199 RepID=A0A1I4XSP5_9CLOT|nr:GNAT family N-acetyltransferase [Proteiniclasticum ruminis]SFN28888.1 Acetyltransferase (GNAT) domain-containing protein [Proteiniclasticum ruminis]
MMLFSRNVRENPQLKESFFELAKEVFGIRFDLWEKTGGWTSAYIPYCFHEDGQVVANASVNLMKLTVEGKIYDAVQIGTVMTRKEHRGQGLSEKLLRKILGDYEGKTDLIYLLADEDAMPLYQRVGFERINTVRCFLPIETCVNEGNPLPVKKNIEDLMALKKSSFAMTDRLWSKEDRHILPFYYVHGFQDMILEPLLDVTILVEMEGDTFHLYDVLSPVKVSLSEVINSIVPQSALRVELHFTPQEMLPGLYTEPDPDSGFMVHKSSSAVIPNNLTYPTIITA